MKTLLMLGIAVLALTLVACSSQNQTGSSQALGETVEVEGGSYIAIDIQELQGMLENKDFTFVNVHIPFEGNIPNTDLSIPYDDIEAHLDELPADKAAKIVLYCRSGRMSAIAAEELVKLGYTNVWNLKQGFMDWEQSGLQLER